MKLYHGTTLGNWEGIRKNGLVPRGRKKSNWRESPSHPDMVYLSNAYAPYFGFVSDSDVAVVIEINILGLPGMLLPDEDALAQCSDPNDGLSLFARTKLLRDDLHHFAYTDLDYRWSLKTLGTCCHEGVIPPRCFSRVAFIDTSVESRLAFNFLDTTISVPGFTIMGAYWQNVTKKIFGDTDFVPSPLEKNGFYRLPELAGGIWVSPAEEVCHDLV